MSMRLLCIVAALAALQAFGQEPDYVKVGGTVAVDQTDFPREGETLSLIHI